MRTQPSKLSSSELNPVLQAASKFHDYIQEECSFYKQYYSTYVYGVLSRWQKFDSLEARSIYEEDPEAQKVIEKYLGESGTWKDLNEKELKLCISALRKIDQKNELSRLPFESMSGLLDNFFDKFSDSYGQWIEQIKSKGFIYYADVEHMTNIGLWHSVYTNDENNRLTPFGSILIRMAEVMNHQPIGVFDALEQHLEPQNVQNEEKALPEWVIDLNAAQLMLLASYQRFRNYFDSLTFKGEDANITKTDVVTLIKAHESVDVKLKYKNYDNEIAFVPDRKIHDPEVALDGSLNLKERIELGINLFSEDAMEDLEENVNDIIGKHKYDLPEEVIGEIYKTIYIKENYKFPPIIQMIQSRPTIWASDANVPAIVIINKKLAMSKSKKSRLEAYIPVMHELGHEIADDIKNDALIEQLKSEIDRRIITKRKKRTQYIRTLWKAWVSEIFADAVGIAMLGKASVTGLIDVLKNSGYPGEMIRANASKKGYDPHPNTYIRGLMAIRMYNIIQNDTFHIASWHKMRNGMNFLRDEYLMEDVPIKRFTRDLDEVAEIVLKTKLICLNGLNLIELIELITNSNEHREFLARFK